MHVFYAMAGKLPAQLFARLVEAGRFGQRAGAGFYNYGDAEAEPLDAIDRDYIEARAAQALPQRQRLRGVCAA